jgi:hypothetical protein
MLGVILAIPLACVPAAPRAADDPMNSTREVGALFATFQLDQALEEGPPLPIPGARLTAVFQRRFGLEASVGKAFLATLSELSAVAVVKLLGDPVLLRAGVSHVPGYVSYANADIGNRDAATGFHVGASLLSGDVDDRVRFRIDYTYRQFGRQERGISSLGFGLVLGLEPD